MPSMMTRRHALCCGGAAVAGLFTSLSSPSAQALWRNPCKGALPASLAQHPLVSQTFAGLDPAQLWDVHAHLLGSGDAGSGCWVDARMSQWWHPMAHARRGVILDAACVPPEAPSIDRAYVQRLQQLTADFPSGARWLLFAFDVALDDFGRPRPDWTTFHVPNAYAAEIAQRHPERFAWVASIHPHRADALEQLDRAIADGAVALKWLPSAMNIDLASPRLASFYARLARSGLPLIVHCGEEKAVPGAGRDELGNPLKVRSALQAGVRVIMAHCASLGEALDLDQRRPSACSAFSLFARLMDEPAWQGLLLGDISAVFQANRSAEVWRTVLARCDWHPRLLHGSDYPLPGVGPLYRPQGMVRAGLLQAEHVPVLTQVRAHNPLLFDLMLKRHLRWQGQGLSDTVFATRRHFERPPKVSPADT